MSLVPNDMKDDSPSKESKAANLLKVSTVFEPFRGITTWILSYILNVGTFIVGILGSGTLLINSPHKGIGVFYFAINLLVGAIVWSSTNRLKFWKSLVSTIVFYASLGACGILASLIGDTLLNLFRESVTDPMEFLEISFYCLLAGLIPCLLLNTWFFISIRNRIPQMCDEVVNKYNLFRAKYRKDILDKNKGSKNKKRGM